jgi:hypothetical protein
MSGNDFHVGQHVEFIGGPFKGEEALVWEIGDEYLELLREQDFELVKTPYYVARRSADLQIRPLQPKQRPAEPTPRDRLPGHARVAYNTTSWRPRSYKFDLHDITVSNGFLGPVLDVVFVRYNGVFPIEQSADLDPDSGWDGSWPYFRRLTEEEWDRIQTAFDELDFWSLPYDDAVRTDGRRECWDLLAYRDGAQHEVWRSYVPNAIEPFCRLLFSLAEAPGLTRGDSSLLVEH